MGLTHSIQSKLVYRLGNSTYRVGASSMQGYREEMEDSHTMILKLPSHPNVALFGVFDGHGGSTASQFVSNRLVSLIDALPNVFDEEVLSKVMVDIDKEFLQTSNSQHGTTSVWAVIEPTSSTAFKAAVANLGDSRFVSINRNGTINFVTQDHKPKLHSETTRIVQAGGFVTGDRVDGQLAVARAIGDSFYKSNPSLAAHQQKVSCVPDISFIEVTDQDIIFIACDGLFEKLTTEQLARFIVNDISLTTNDPAVIACSLLDYSLEAGSRDNMSAIVLTFNDGSDYKRNNEFVAGPFYQWSHDTRFRKAYETDAKRSGITGKDLYDRALSSSHAEINRFIADLEAKSVGDNNRLLELNAMKKKVAKEINEAYESDVQANGSS